MALASRTRIDFQADETFQVDGVRAERQRTTCTVDTLNRVTVCSGTVFIPSLNVAFRAESSSTSSGEVDRILERIMIVPDKVNAGRTLTQFSESNPAARPGEQYAEWLTELGLKPNIQTKKSPGHIPGDVLAASPSAGTMLRPGAEDGQLARITKNPDGPFTGDPGSPVIQGRTRG
ncbi:PASTA domain-containing protein [Kribbella sp. NPDC050124]|uniref:PASTA domain-containing protein n=1 Tax=Kribbella sp. NPDC050124 TaxID=3364114 RepID=UPI00379204ED